MTLDLRLITDIEFDGIDRRDYPDFCDAYISAACYDGEPMTDEQLEEVNNNAGFVYDKLMEHLF